MRCGRCDAPPCRSHVTAGVSAEDLEAFTQHYAQSGRVQPRGNNLFDRGPSWEE